ncbi:hypothetical protein [Arthrobacter cavernae]|uniref:Uncharacterized protein n=1 Tax=Arthrobacter cavernae TaxID=2817681 RepID=A0A939HK84_9MICC|nr:hypothetical protein [Arthrobacter cavernae]MBO1268823.1 hypothetical protein [Arthrobacter cavernae]
MTEASWRDSVPEASAADLETLLGTGIGAAREQLEEHGGFLPFALVMEHGSDIRLLAVAPEAGRVERAGSAEAANGEAGDQDESGFDADSMIQDLTELLRQNRGDFRAAALVCDIMLVDEDSDAIHVAAEHCDGSVFAAVLPYGPGATGPALEFGQLAADTNEPVVWVD